MDMYIINFVRRFIADKICNTIYEKVLLITSLSTFSVYFISITEVLQPYTPYIYYIAFYIGIITELHIRYLIFKNREAIIENISKDKIKRNIMNLETKSIKCNEIPEIEF